jgi:hypothetical protein
MRPAAYLFTARSGLLGPQSPVRLIRAINGLGSMTWFNEQMMRMSTGLEPDPKLGFISAFVRMQRLEKRLAHDLVREK